VILSRAEIKPHRTEYWVMTDFDQPYFEERCSEVCGLYLNPPENALVLSIDELCEASHNSSDVKSSVM
jgi:hypothetical protein